MQVFISYAHTDADASLALRIADRLRSAGFTVWHDRASLSPADRTREAIERAARASDHAVFLVSRSWLARDWTEWELGLFEHRDPKTVRRVPVLRRPRRELQLPPALYRFTGFEWLEEEADEDARFWELYCALSGRVPGPPQHWTEEGRKFSSGAGPPPRRTPEAVRPSLKCDRSRQWTTTDSLASSGGNELILVPGEAGQDHEHFTDRIQTYFRPDPPRSIVAVEWTKRRPASQGEFREAVATALHVSAAYVETTLGERLAHENLVLLHPCIRARFLDPQLVSYYAGWWPAWLSGIRSRQNLKCVQPVEWPPETLLTSVRRWLAPREAGNGDARPDADHLIRQVLDGSAPLLRAVRLADLQDVTRVELEEFCDVQGLTPRQREWLLERISGRRARTPQEVFQAIDDYYPDLPDDRRIA